MVRRGNGAGYGGPAKGPGWGGPPKGSGNGSPRFQDFPPGHRNLKSAIADNDDPDEQAYRRDRKVRKRELRERMMAVLIRNAEDTTNVGAAQVLAANAVLDRIDGKPVAATQMVVADDVSAMTDAELAAEIRRLTIEGEMVPEEPKQIEAPQGVEP